jgi:hypothetical protein
MTAMRGYPSESGPEFNGGRSKGGHRGGFRPDGKRLASTSMNSTVGLWGINPPAKDRGFHWINEVPFNR